MKLVLRIAFGIVLGFMLLGLTKVAMVGETLGMLRTMLQQINANRTASLDNPAALQPTAMPAMLAPAPQPQAPQTQPAQPLFAFPKPPVASIQWSNPNGPHISAPQPPKPVARNSYFRPPAACEHLKDNWEALKACTDHIYGPRP